MKKDRKCYICKADLFVTIWHPTYLFNAMTMQAFSYIRKTIALAALAVTSVAVGQNPQQTTQTQEQLEIIDEIDQPAITIRKPDTTGEITEKRDGGMVEEIKVKSGPSTYYLYPNGRNGVPGSFESSEVRPALWRVHEFDIGEAKQDEKKEVKDATLNAPALPPPSMK